MADFIDSLDPTTVTTSLITGLLGALSIVFVNFLLRRGKREENQNTSEANETNSFTAITNNLFLQLAAHAEKIERLEAAAALQTAKVNEQGVKIGEQQIKILGLESERERLTEVIGRRDRYISKLLASWGQSTTAPRPDE
ncbi:holin/anti-holin [Clavibacter phage CN1A]|uniref:Holin/anti-holin n=2 Tax=Viruses TaxID=10239 RepID=U5PXG8_9CAUD|nr:holin/anti-holin [Clavibacter phage CN1A]ACY27522.1 hypothetical protein CN77-04 [Clavibacter phage CN77]AGY47143.1 holin/anti-holin [Clavibacter phage CN1A]